jgi:inorganic pyrophosphatase
LVLLEESGFPHCRLRGRPIGVFWMSDDADHEHFRAGTGHFFEVYEALEPSKVTEVRGWQGHDEAHEVIGASRERFIPEWGDLE